MRAFNSSFGHGIRLHNILPLDKPLWFIDIALKFGAQLSISINIFQVFGMTQLWMELTTFRSGGERSTFTLPVGRAIEEVSI